MAPYDPSTYGAQIADVYDTWFGASGPAAVDTLHTLAGGGPALELGIGTRGIALPLSERGLAVHRIDASPASDGVFMIEAFVPEVARYSSGQTFRTVDVATQSARLEATRHDPVQRRVTTSSSRHISVYGASPRARAEGAQ